MRVFIAIDINEKIRKALGDLQRQLAGKANIDRSDVKWVRPDAIHLTLNFLGEIDDGKANEVCDIVKDVSAKHKCFEVNVETVGCFGGRSARVIWVGAGEGNENLKRLQKELEQALMQAGWPKEEREFTGHLTLCRVKNPKAGIKLAQTAEQYKDFKAGVVSADSVNVYKSELTPTGPIYTVIGSYKLQ
jgi:2'-5' RNA ligase